LIGAFKTECIMSSCNFLVAYHEKIYIEAALRYTKKEIRKEKPMIIYA